VPFAILYNNTSRKEKRPAEAGRCFYFLPDIQPRVSNDTRNRDALAIVAAFVRFNALEILFTPALDFAIVFNVRTSVAVHGRLTTPFFLAKFRFLFF